MNHTCINNQKREGFFQIIGQGDGEPCARLENEGGKTNTRRFEMDDELRNYGYLSLAVTIPTDKMSEYASQSPELLGNW